MINLTSSSGNLGPKPLRLVWRAFAGGYGPALGLVAFVAAIPLALCTIIGALSLAPPFVILQLNSAAIPVWLPPLMGAAVGLSLYLVPRTTPRAERLAMALPAGLGTTLLLNGAALTILRDPGGLFLDRLVAWSLLFSILRSGHVISANVLELARARDRRGAVGAIAWGVPGAALGGMAGYWATIFNGGDPFWVLENGWFYGIFLPSLMGYGWTARIQTHPSPVFAAVAGFYAVAAALIALFSPSSQPHEIECTEGMTLGTHRYHGYYGEPWRWNADRPEFWPLAPIGLAELTRFNVLQPQPVCEAS